MKFVSRTSEKGLHIKPGELVIGCFPNGTGVNVHVENSAIVLLKSKMNARELVNACLLYTSGSPGILHMMNIWTSSTTMPVTQNNAWKMRAASLTAVSYTHLDDYRNAIKEFFNIHTVTPL